MAQAIQRQLEEVEVKQKELEDRGVVLEKNLSGEDTSRRSILLSNESNLIDLSFRLKI